MNQLTYSTQFCTQISKQNVNFSFESFFNIICPSLLYVLFQFAHQKPLQKNVSNLKVKARQNVPHPLHQPEAHQWHPQTRAVQVPAPHLLQLLQWPSNQSLIQLIRNRIRLIPPQPIWMNLLIRLWSLPESQLQIMIPRQGHPQFRQEGQLQMNAHPHGKGSFINYVKHKWGRRVLDSGLFHSVLCIN